MSEGIPDRQAEFTPDPFQSEAIELLRDGFSVVVCAPTGSGKTFIAEAAASFALDRGERLYYTTPLKALSNQKFRDFGALFGESRCGLLTGDITIRPHADVVIMTTEVLRNMLVRGDGLERMSGVRYIVFDECHYLGKFGRGTVWEEAILCIPPTSQILALSATIPNGAEIAGWIDSIHPTTRLVQSNVRPAPLRFFYYTTSGMERLSLRSSAGHGGSGRKIENRRPRPTPARPPSFRNQRGWRGVRRREEAIERERIEPVDIVDELNRREMLPALYFVFSRRGCEAALLSCSGLQLLTPPEAEKAAELIDRWAEEQPSLLAYPFLRELEEGLAVHHAGMLPSWRLAVERLFQLRLVKLVFATETLSAGINMPARTTVISALRRRGDHGVRTLTATEFHQMAGRAGRRGMDPWGNVVVLEDTRVSRDETLQLVRAGPEPLGSCLAPGYSLAVNWLPRHGENGAQRLIRSGLGAYLSERFGHHSWQTAWRSFQAARCVLDHYGAFEGHTLTPLGRLVAAVQSENELQLALAIQSLDPNLPPRLLAASLGAIAGASSGRVSASASRPEVRPPRLLRAALAELARQAAQLTRRQKECGFACAAAISPDFARLVYLWAGKVSWDELLTETELDEGDLVYAVRNTIDLLHQIGSAPVPKSLRQSAEEARQLLDRPPVSEIL